LSRASSKTETASGQVLNSAQILTHESSRLKHTVEEFLGRVRAA
jgi:methyl-accepting chemotaxis protein